MALLDKLKSLLGLDDGRSGSDRQGTDETGVTVEREQGASGEDAPPASPAPGSEDATPEPAAETEPDAGTEPNATAEPDSEPDVDPEVESPGAESTVGESVDELEGRGATDEPETEPASGPAADADSEPLETVDPEPEPESEDAAETEPEVDSEPEPEIGDESGADPGSEAADDPVREIKGIGPSYATKLSEAGVESAGDLAAADAGELSEETGLSEKRIQGWIERAQAR